MKEIKNEMKDLYLSDQRHWIVSFSGGKDSSKMLQLVWEVLEDLPLEQRFKPVYVLMSITGVETPIMIDYMENTMQNIASKAKEKNLPIVAEICRPKMKDSFYYTTLGKGLLVITPKSKNRHCTHRLKINPVKEKIKEIIANSPFTFDLDTQVVQLLGTRLDESLARAASIKKHEIRDTKFSRHSEFPEIMCYMPIKYMTTDEVWLTLPETFGWGTTLNELLKQYGDSSFLECGLKDRSDDTGDACGKGSRNGCYVCTAMGHGKDTMLEGLIQEGHTELQYLYDWKRQLFAMRDDVRYREFERRQWRKQHIKRLDLQSSLKEQVNLFEDFANPNLTYEELKSMHDLHEYENFDRANDIDYNPGGLSFEGRKMMLEKLLWIEQQTGYHLISETEIQAIIGAWEEDGYYCKRSDIIPTNHEYDGALVLNPDGSVNKKETTCTSPIFIVSVDFSDGRDKMVEFIEKRKKKTGQNFYYYTTHWDMGENEKFVWNQAHFIVCKPTIHSQEQASQLIYNWLNPMMDADYKQEDHSLTGYINRRLNQLIAVVNEKPILINEVINELIKLKKQIKSNKELSEQIENIIERLKNKLVA